MVHINTKQASKPIGQDATEIASPTPTPWFHRQAGKTSRRGEAYDWIADSPEHGKHRKIIVCRDACDPADYAFIVKCVNSHDALVKALEECASRCRYDGDLFFDQGNTERMRASWNAADLADAALSSLKESK